MIKPCKLNPGDTIATISPSWGCAGAPRVLWKYHLGVKRLEELGLNVVAAPNSLKGTEYLKNNPEARAEDLMWAFENKKVNAIIANVGGNDSEKLLPFLSPASVLENPKILCGYSDVMSIHLYCYQIGLSTFYGDNLLTTVADAGGWHPYSRHWFKKVLFDNSPVGPVPPSNEWSYDENNYVNREYQKKYHLNKGYTKIQGRGTVRGKLFGGHGGMMEYDTDSLIHISSGMFDGKILFYEDIPEVCDVDYIGEFFDWLGSNGYLQILRGIIIGKMRTPKSFDPYAERIREIVSGKYALPNLPIMCDLNFGHTVPITVLPYNATAELNMDDLTFSLLESGVE